MKKITLLFFSILIYVTTLNSQNLLQSLYSLEQFPAEMDKSKNFIKEATDGILMYDFIASNGNYQFNKKAKEAVVFKLPLQDDFSLHFFNPKSKEAYNEVAIYIIYTFNYLEYFDKFELNEDTFSLSSLFDLATRYSNFDEYQLVHEMLANFNPGLDYNTRRILFFEEAAKAVQLEEIPNFKEVVSPEDLEEMSSKEVEEMMLDEILDAADSENIIPQLFNHFILDTESEQKTKQRIFKLFNDQNILEETEQKILQPKINIEFSKECFLSFPKNMLQLIDRNDHLFRVKSLNIAVDFKNKRLIIDFIGKNYTDITINNADYKGKKVKDEIVRTKQLRIVVENTKTEFQIFKQNTMKAIPYTIPLKQ
ncbi:hypothetical protein U8527_16415 [Kordia algicida OT-1]|uniref:Uncharacterized protein n=1 Tax=Kordia algicida OT-1 TaxID=391587 RepID=A9ECM7_9FLAO|nr:hypothetical protein [Kordia algicida]EDP94389.1 hypothetical protein KAOT1_10081 [Kordia algicida OT-1]